MLWDAGFIAYLVGGSVRDALLGRDAAGGDLDIATDASPDEILRLFPSGLDVGKQFGVIKIPIEGVAHPLEIATFREDLDYGADARRPKGVRFSSPEEDARRRDFTVNGLFFDPKTGRVLDCVGGMADLATRTLRAIGDPELRFGEDALRLLRAVRLSATLDFELEPATADAIRRKAPLLARVSGERIREELEKLWASERVIEGMRGLERAGLLKTVFPELAASRDVDGRLKLLAICVAERPRGAPSPTALFWAAVLTQAPEPDPERRATTLGHRLRLSRAETETVAWLLDNLPRCAQAFAMREATILRWVAHPEFELLLSLARARALATDGNLAHWEFLRARRAEWRAQRDRGIPRLIGGEDLIELGFSPGPKFAEILRTVEDLALEAKLKTKDEALEFVIRQFVR